MNKGEFGVVRKVVAKRQNGWEGNNGIAFKSLLETRQARDPWYFVVE